MMNNNKYYIYYHTDADGKGSAAVAILYLLHMTKINEWNSKDVELIPFSYEKIDTFVPLRDYKLGDTVFIVDLSVDSSSLPKFISFLELLNGVGVKLYWIDHHKSSKNCLSSIPKATLDTIEYVIDTDYCGMCNCWRYFFNNLPMPEIVRLIDDWDCWKLKLSTTKDFHYGFDASGLDTPTNADWKSYLLDRGECLKLISKCIEDGKAIQKYIKIEDTNKFDYHFDCKFCGFSCCCLNVVRNSDIFLDKIEDYDIVLAFMYNGNTYKYSIYCRKDSEAKCNIIAEIFGGGGHKGAAGFRSKKLVVNNYNSIFYKIKEMFRKHRYKKYSKREGK